MGKSNFPIGIFDSGIGGTSIWKEIVRALPYEHTIYLSDSKNAPYGNKPKSQILKLAIKNTELLLEKGCKIIVVACNTATTNTISYLRENYKVPFIGIEPAIKPASLKTKSKIVGILATKGTLNSELFATTSSKLGKDIIVKEKIGKGLVELIESGKIDSEEMAQLLKSYIHPLLDQGVDCLVLGCTHYPYLIPQIQKIVGKDFSIIDSGEAVARQTKNILDSTGLLNEDTSEIIHEFYTNTDKSVLCQFVPNNRNIHVVEKDF